MLKNGMRSNSFKKEDIVSNKNVPIHNLLEIIQYCKLKGISIEDLSLEELKSFEIK